MQKVSYFTKDRSIKSAYLDIDYRPSHNLALQLDCSTLIYYVTLYDLMRDDKTYQGLVSSFSDALHKCENQIQISEVYELLKRISNIGEVGKDFYNRVKGELDKHLSEDLFKETDPVLSEAIYQNNMPVSINSKYFELDYRPKKKELDDHTQKLLRLIAIFDINRTPENFAMLLNSFQNGLAICQTNQDLDQYRTFLADAAQIGYAGYALYQRVKNDISLKNKKEDALASQKTTQKDAFIDSFTMEFSNSLDMLSNLMNSSYDNADLVQMENIFSNLSATLKTLEASMTPEEYAEYETNINDIRADLVLLREDVPKFS